MSATLFKIIECTLKSDLEKEVSEFIKKGFVVHGELQVGTRSNFENERSPYYRISVVSYSFDC